MSLTYKVLFLCYNMQSMLVGIAVIADLGELFWPFLFAMLQGNMSCEEGEKELGWFV